MLLAPAVVPDTAMADDPQRLRTEATTNTLRAHLFIVAALPPDIDTQLLATMTDSLFRR